MPRPDPALLDPARYPFACRIEPRFGDLDVNRHINNTALVGLIEEGRVRFHAASGFHQALDGISAMVASLSVEYLAQAFYPDPLELRLGAAALGRTSYRMAIVVRQGESTIAFAEAVMVCIGAAGPVPLPDSFRAGIFQWMMRAEAGA
ncbi:MAG: acyl-CoA thioesterase [Novosphingobium sp.]|nr:acyl-CoA thioesterase [Novosphingobium sp.]